MAGTILEDFMRKTLLSLLAFAVLAGCGSSSDFATNANAATTTRTFSTVFDQQTLPNDVDSVHAVFKDADGAIVLGPVEVPVNLNGFQITGVPNSAVQVEVDWLRNGGFALFESVHTLAGGGVLAQGDAGGHSVTDPTLGAAQAGHTAWSAQTNPAQFSVAVTGNPGQDVTASTGPFPVRGVGYSPAPIGFSNKFGPSLGDLFWDGGENIPGAGVLLDWEKVWKRDIEDIRPHFNSVRVYNMLELQLGDDGSFPNVNSAPFRTHLKFLDELWNNGHEPIYVLVGLPSSAAMYLPGGNPIEKAFFEANLARTATQLADHPAVMGFTLLNELGGAAEWGGNQANSDFYWGAIQTNSGVVKNAAPDKLVGFAYFDAPPDVTAASNGGFMEQYGDNLDFWGGNVFQSTVLGPSLAPYRSLGNATKPFLFTEFGVPGTSHSDTSVCSGNSPTQAGVDSIFADATTIQTSADALDIILPQALNDEIVAGMFYFEWCDEWWKQDPNNCYTTNITTQEGGQSAPLSQFVNGFNDEEGYGLHSIALNNRAAGAVFAPFDPNAATANNQPDILTTRQTMLDAVSGVFQAR
jgi:hypothetical protein